MSDLLAARPQMGMSLAFHIIFAAVGMALPLIMTIAELLWHKTGDTGPEKNVFCPPNWDGS
jgi:cytochrome d ubiquinol oxidase subunit I